MALHVASPPKTKVFILVLLIQNHVWCVPLASPAEEDIRNVFMVFVSTFGI